MHGHRSRSGSTTGSATAINAFSFGQRRGNQPNVAEPTGRGNTSIANLHEQALGETGSMHRAPSMHWPDIAEARSTDLGPIKDLHKPHPHSSAIGRPLEKHSMLHVDASVNGI